MKYLHILCFICVGFHSFASTTEAEYTFHDAIIEKCPSLKSLSTSKDHPIFKVCKSWKNISQVYELTKENKIDILCLTYFETFTQTCMKTPILNATLPPSTPIYDLSQICEYLKDIPHQNLSRIYLTGDNCNQICSDGVGYTNFICSTSYYFAHRKVEPQIDGESNKQKIQEVKQGEAQEAAEPLKKETVVEDGVNAKPPQVAGEKESESGVNPKLNVPQPPDVVVQPDSVKSKLADAQPQPNDNPAKIESPQNEVDPSPNQSKVGKTNDGVNVKKQSPPVDESPKVPTPTERANVNTETEKAEENLVKPDDMPDDEKVDLQDMSEEVNPKQQVGSPDTDTDDEGPMPETLDDPKQHQEDLKPLQTDESEPINYNTEMEGDSYFFTYFMLLCIIFIVCYVCYHNKQKILALILEGRRGKRQYRGRRPNSANYHKLDSNLEEALTSSSKKNTNNVIY